VGTTACARPIGESTCTLDAGICRHPDPGAEVLDASVNEEVFIYRWVVRRGKGNTVRESALRNADGYESKWTPLV